MPSTLLLTIHSPLEKLFPAFVKSSLLLAKSSHQTLSRSFLSESPGVMGAVPFGAAVRSLVLRRRHVPGAVDHRLIATPHHSEERSAANRSDRLRPRNWGKHKTVDFCLSSRNHARCITKNNQRLHGLRTCNAYLACSSMAA
jgi:hypothetical protein